MTTLHSTPFGGDKTRFKFAVNTAGTDKDWDFKLLASQFKDREGTIEDVRWHVKAGHALCAGLLGNKRRVKSNVIGSWWILLDVDNSDILRDEAGLAVKGENGKAIKIYKPELTLEEAIAHLFVQKHCALIYTTATHKPDWHKFRLVFLLPEFVEGADTVEACVRLLQQQFPHDPNCKDASRVFYGSTLAEFPLVQPNVVLPSDWVQKARDAVENKQIKFKPCPKPQPAISLHPSEKYSTDDINWAKSYLSALQPYRADNYFDWLQVGMSLKSVDESLLGEWDAWSQQSPNYEPGECEKKWKSFKSSGLTIGTLAYFAKQDGWTNPFSKNSPQPNHHNDEPNQAAYAEYIRQEREDERTSQAEEFRDLINKSVGKIKRFLGRSFKGFSKQHITQKAIPKSIKIKPGEVPTPEEYEILGKPRLDYKGEDRNAIWAESAAKGWRHILDNSGTGSGKSHAAGEALPSQFGVKNLWYFAADHRNPTTLTIETNYTDLPVRNNGFKIDKTRQTPSGRYFQVWAKVADVSDTFTIGNCDRTHFFHALAEKNISVQQSGTSPICKSCPHSKKIKIEDELKPKCSAVIGDGFGFRAEYSSILAASELLRAHPNSAPQDEYDYSNAGAFWDEAGILIETQSVLEVNLFDLQQTYHKVATALLDNGHYKFNNELEPLWQVLTGLLDSNYGGYIADNGRFGMKDTEIRGLLPDPPENLDAIIEFLNQALQPDLSFLAEKTDQVDFKSVGRQDKRYAWAAQQAFNSQSAREKLEGLQKVLLNWFVPFLMAWRDNSGYFKREFGSVLKIYSRSNRHTDIASSMKWNIYLDATLSSQMLEDMLGTDIDGKAANILHIKEEMPSFKNLRIVQITGMGRLSADRRESASRRVAAVLAELEQRHPGIAVIDWKAKVTNDQHGYHFRDGRGVNRFKGTPALAIVGTPTPNIGAMAIKYQLLKNKPAIEDSLEFRAFVDEHIQSELIQEIGRPRANQRTEEVSVYILNDYDLAFLRSAFPDATIEQLDAFKLNPNAGDKLQHTRYAILKAFSQLVDAGADSAKITQEAISKSAEITRSRIAQIAQDFGGWTQLRKLLVLLYRSLNSKINNSENVTPPGEEPDSTLLWMANEYLPLLAANPDDSPSAEVVENIFDIISVEGWKRFKVALQLTDRTSKMGVLAHLIALFPDQWWEEFLDFRSFS
ncbi:PriCT-2 domain-containing protein [Tolypothrix sp. VBCCA 56010]|uniref:PriCT-2 domain-containing protein n=1 Tax=Tolypothrix sp. VBCCA 56010 TaxID=3137731 RepID=UPI003D7CE122